jgi:hypothetical protein
MLECSMTNARNAKNVREELKMKPTPRKTRTACQAELQKTIRRIQQESVRKGTDKITMAEIDVRSHG